MNTIECKREIIDTFALNFCIIKPPQEFSAYASSF